MSYVYMNICIYVSMYIYVYIYIYVCVCVRIYVYMNMWISMCVRMHVCKYTHTYTHVYIYIYIHINKYKWFNGQVYIYIYICVCVCVCERVCMHMYVHWLPLWNLSQHCFISCVYVDNLNASQRSCVTSEWRQRACCEVSLWLCQVAQLTAPPWSVSESSAHGARHLEERCDSQGPCDRAAHIKRTCRA